MTEAKERLVEDEKRQNQRPLISAVAGIASAAFGLLVGSVLHLILSPIEWAQVIESVSFEITNGFDRRRFIASAGFREFSKQIEWAEYLLSFTGGIISIVISLATI